MGDSDNTNWLDFIRGNFELKEEKNSILTALSTR